MDVTLTAGVSTGVGSAARGASVERSVTRSGAAGASAAGFGLAATALDPVPILKLAAY